METKRETLQKTVDEIIRVNNEFESDLRENLKKHYKDEEDLDMYYEGTLNELYQNGVLRWQGSQAEIYWYTDEDGDPWTYEIPDNLTKDGTPRTVDAIPLDLEYDIVTNFYSASYNPDGNDVMDINDLRG